MHGLTRKNDALVAHVVHGGGAEVFLKVGIQIVLTDEEMGGDALQGLGLGEVSVDKVDDLKHLVGHGIDKGCRL